jgi:hypothetical protein
MRDAALINTYLLTPAGGKSPTRGVDLKTLAYLNFGLFKQLRKLGTSKERICSALSLSFDDYDYITQLE